MLAQFLESSLSRVGRGSVQPNLWVLPAGAVPADPVALASQEIATLL
jgi:hypothetical protein